MTIEDVTVVQRAMQALVDRDDAAHLACVSDTVQRYMIQYDGRPELVATGKAEYAGGETIASMPPELGFKRFRAFSYDTKPDDADAQFLVVFQVVVGFSDEEGSQILADRELWCRVKLTDGLISEVAYLLGPSNMHQHP